MIQLYQKGVLQTMKQAPDFKLADQDGKVRSLSDYADKWLVLYFYPKDNTPGCTTEACSFRDERDAIAEYGNATVVGISKDSVESHKKFIDKHKLNFTLLSDESHETIEAYDSWGPKKFMGREYIGISRNTFIIDPKGKIVKEYLGVDPKKHVTEIIKDLQELQKA
jgi:peroxiredoxin Q/BCP